MLEELSFLKIRKEVQSIVGVVNKLSSWVTGLSIKMKHLRQFFPKEISVDLEAEFNILKKSLREKVSLSPLGNSYLL